MDTSTQTPAAGFAAPAPDSMPQPAPLLHDAPVLPRRTIREAFPPDSARREVAPMRVPPTPRRPLVRRLVTLLVSIALVAGLAAFSWYVYDYLDETDPVAPGGLPAVLDDDPVVDG